MVGLFDVLSVIGAAAATIALGYSGFWALTVRRALAISIYRKQALGVAFISIVLGLSTAANTVSAYLIYHNPFEAIGQSGYGLFFVLLIALFYLVDTSAIASRRTDPLSRDTLHWSKLRLVLWAGTLPAAVLVIPANIYFLFALGGNVSSPPPASLGIILFPGIFIPPISAAVVLPIASRRTADHALRKQLKWFALFAAALLILNLFLSNSVPNQSLGLMLDYIGSVVDAFCLYQSASSLVPFKPELG